MNFITKYGVAIFVILFIVASGYNLQQYASKVEKADIIFAQLDSEFVNNYYDNVEKDLEITNNNAKENEKNLYNNVSEQQEETTTHPLDNLEIPVFTDGVEAYMFAENVLKMASGVHIEAKGIADAGIVKQPVRSVIKRDNSGQIYYLNASYSAFVKTAMELFYNNRMLKVRNSSSVSSDLSVKFDDKKWVASSLTSHVAQYGMRPDEMVYIVNQNTVNKVEDFNFDGNKYTFKLILNPNTATVNYNKTLKVNANSSTDAKFSEVTLTLIIDKNARFESIAIKEKYTISAMGFFNTTINAEIKNTFHVVHGDVTIETPSGF